MIRRKRGARNEGLADLMDETSRLVAKLVSENRALRAQNVRLTKELDRLSAGWEQLKLLAKSAPRSRRSGRK